MFTGIVKGTGTVKSIVKQGRLCRIGVAANRDFPAVDVSDSVAINGVCLTVTKKEGNTLFFEAIAPTLENSNLKRLKQGVLVNLEPSLKIGDSLDGHFVLGHVDCECRINSIKKNRDFFVINLKIPGKYQGFVLEKGSVAVDGVSVTIQRRDRIGFDFYLIPYTLENTAWKQRKPGDWVNVEYDYLIKAVRGKLLS